MSVLRIVTLSFLAVSLAVGLYVVIFTIFLVGHAVARSIWKRNRRSGSYQDEIADFDSLGGDYFRLGVTVLFFGRLCAAKPINYSAISAASATAGNSPRAAGNWQSTCH